MDGNDCAFGILNTAKIVGLDRHRSRSPRPPPPMLPFHSPQPFPADPSSSFQRPSPSPTASFFGRLSQPSPAFPSAFHPSLPVQPVQKKRSTDAAASQQQQGSAPFAENATGEKRGECICERDLALVVCRRCGHDLVGRVQRCCPQHPKRISLMDLRECPNTACRSVHLSEVKLEK
ncbi:hypothetical protein GPALN_006497 [Globodera pallida]|nr:hypothetical protein GPALN_006497 [Globodera pallida]